MGSINYTARAAVTAALALACVAPATAKPATAHAPRYGDTTEFAKVGAPGYPYGLLTTKRAVYVTTSRGNATRANTGDEALFTYTPKGKLLATTPVTAMPNMGLHDLAVDGAGRLYVGDMNGRVLRYEVDSRGVPHDPIVYASVAAPDDMTASTTSMWQGLAFDHEGNLYVADGSQPRIWRIPPGGKPEVWFESLEFATVPALGVGLTGMAVGPDGHLYVALAGSPLPNRFGEGAIYRLPLGDPPTADKLELFHRFGTSTDTRPTPFPIAADLAFGRSGRLYVTLTGSNQVAVLSPAGEELRRISSPLFDIPIGIRFQGRSLLLANSNFFPPEQPDHWKVLKTYVGERGLPLIRPEVR